MSAGPDDLIYEENRTPLFLAAVFTPEEAASECGLTVDEADITEEWQRFRDLTAAEKADPEKVFDIFMGSVDPEFDGIPDRVYWQVSDGIMGAHKYLRVTEKPAASQGAS